MLCMGYNIRTYIFFKHKCIGIHIYINEKKREYLYGAAGGKIFLLMHVRVSLLIKIKQST